jgi:hypothetical protein
MTTFVLGSGGPYGSRFKTQANARMNFGPRASSAYINIMKVTAQAP